MLREEYDHFSHKMGMDHISALDYGVRKDWLGRLLGIDAMGGTWG